MTVRAEYRGVRWRRDDAGVTSWFNDGARRWVRWYPGADAPPLPPKWAADRPAAPPTMSRPRWRSPYRLVPIALALFVVGYGTWQALRSTHDPVKAEAARTAALLHRCLAQDGTTDGHPVYKSSPVSCELPVADVEVVDVLAGTPGAPSCPARTTAVQFTAIGVRYPHVECVVPVHPSA